MSKTRTVVSLALLASTAACSSGGGSAPAAGPSGASSPQTSASSASPSASLDLNSNPAQLTLHVPDVGMDHTFALNGNSLQNATFNGVPIGNLANGATNFAIKSDNNGHDVLIYDAGDLSFTRYGIWSHSDATGKVLAVGSVATGVATPVTDIPTTGAASYSGGVVATGTTGTGNLNLTGTFNAAVNFASRGLDFSSNLFTSDASGVTHAWGGINGSATITAGTSAFAGTVRSSGTADQLSGTMNGSFSGPGAKEIGGAFGAAGGQTTIVGAFGGSVQAPQVSGGAGVNAVFGSGTFSNGASGGTSMVAGPSGRLPGATQGAFGSLAGGSVSTSPIAGGTQGGLFGPSTTSVGAFGGAPTH